MDDNSELIVVDDLEEENSQKTPRKTYTKKFKKEVILFALRSTNSCAARAFNVDRRCVIRWVQEHRKIHEEVENGDSNRKRSGGAGRPLTDKSFDEKLKNWILEQRKQKMRISRRIIKTKALAWHSNPLFAASNGWLESFMHRHKFSLRRPTTVCQKPPKAFTDAVVDFLIYIEQLRKKNIYDHVYAADETAVYLDFSKTLTVEEKGARQVSVKSTGHDKLHVTVMLTARQDGFKCRPFVLLPLLRPKADIIKQFGNKLELCWAGRTFFNDDLTEKYLQKVFGSSLFGKRLLVWDSFRCHISKETKKVLRDLKIHTASIPGGTTKYIQAPDVFWNAPFKAYISQKYEDWMLEGEKSVTKGGNPRPPPMKEYLQWIVEAWEHLPTDLIKRSFIGCGLNNDSTGADDDFIHILREDGEMPRAKELLRKKREEYEEEEIIQMVEEIDVAEDNPDDSDAELDFED
ncbi:hypothetical protein CAEBREN_15225 [Caenorhabditis brenneri]|uniref:HTH CENPB-type domain-containing protein n=1 Tax=Caenorhabditis brenneri TaxID=135651 RepID=G0NC46_CAEBE|nr:hypothetical protein CAEBREN_15225 [Caenorhabditis brenneri]